VLGHFDVRDGVVVAHSAGAIGTLALAAEAPDMLAARVRGLVLASAPPRGIGDSLPKRLQASILLTGLIGRVLRRSDTPTEPLPTLRQFCHHPSGPTSPTSSTRSGCADRVQAVALAYRTGLIDSDQ
jgi:pimeloyl-ACP methyl ester carboxylesterase